MSELIFVGLVLSGAWTQLDEIGWIGWAALAVVFVFDSLAPRISWPRPAFPSAKADRAAATVAAVLCAFVMAHLALTFREEFGFSGDEGYHLSATRAFAIYFMRAGPMLLAVIAIFTFLRFKRFRYAATISVASLLAASYALPLSALFGRYPTAFYLLSTPLNVLFDVVHLPYPYTANHIVNTLSVPIWLFVLRPLIIGRWPDWRVLPVALLVYVQPPALVYLASPLLEPWAIVFVLLSMEAIVALDTDRRWVAVPLSLIAVCFKESMILLMPTAWLLACVEWRNGRPALRPGSIALGIAAVAPFLVYYAVRAELSTAREYGAVTGAPLFTPARLSEWLSNAQAQAGVGSLITVAAAAVFTATTAPLWVLTALGIAVFFFADPISVPWTGYSRFLAYSVVALGGAIFATVYQRQIARRTLIAICAVIAILQLPATLTTFALDFGGDHERNSLEWRQALIRMPIRALAARIPSTTGGEQVRRLRVTVAATDLTSLSVAYPDVARLYTLSTSTSDCSCRDNDEAVLGGFEWPANLSDTPAAHDAFSRISAACVAQAQATCGSTIIERDRSGAAIGVLGVGRR